MSGPLSQGKDGRPEVPEGVPAALKIGLAAAVLNLSERTVRYRVDRGDLLAFTASDRPNAARYIPAAEVARFAARLGIETRWELALE